MSLVVGAPFCNGVVVASDLAATRRSCVRFGVTKLSLVGGVLVSLTGRTWAETDEGRPLFSLRAVLAHAAPERVKAHHIPSLAATAAATLERVHASYAAPDDGVVAVFWMGHGCHLWYVQRDVHGVLRASDVQLTTFGPNTPWAPVSHGMSPFVREHVIDAGRLAPSSYALRRQPPVRNVSREQAEAYVRDVIEAATRATQVIPCASAIGGGVDVRIVDLAGVVRSAS
jgi:hypothetical protein